MRRLDVYMNDTKAGLLSEESPGIGYNFTYTPEYLASDLPPVSLKLPKRAEPYYSESLFPLFCNIVPEGGNRRVICRKLHIDPDDTFGLLEAMSNRDFVGAVNVRLPEND